MARPVTIQTERILEAARSVFMKHGYRASTAQIAKAAGVSEGSLFKHFKTKVNLFLAALDVKPGEQSWQDRLMASVGSGNIRSTLEEAGIQLLEQLRIILPRLMMINSSGIIIPKHDHPGVPPPPLQKMEVMCAYFKLEIKAGRLAMASPEILSHAFLGALSHYAWCETILGYRAAPPKVYVKTLVDTFLKAAGRPPIRKKRKTRQVI